MVLLKNLILRNDTLKDIFKECSSEKMDFLINGISSKRFHKKSNNKR